MCIIIVFIPDEKGGKHMGFYSRLKALLIVVNIITYIVVTVIPEGIPK